MPSQTPLHSTSALSEVNTELVAGRGVMNRECWQQDGGSEVGDAEHRPGVAPEQGTRLGGVVSVDACGFDSVAAVGGLPQSAELRTSPLTRAGDPGGEAATSLDTTGTSDDVADKCLSAHELGPRGEDCGQWVELECSHCGNRRRVYQACGRRFRCRWCRAGWLRECKRRYYPVLRAMRGRLRFVTLTVKNGPDLRERIRALSAAFKKLKQRKQWKRWVRGGVRAFEVTHGTDGWHAHYHLIVNGSFIPQRELSQVWLECTGDSPIVDVREVKGSLLDAGKELFKYTLKDMGLDSDKLDEAEAALKGRRMLCTLGEQYRRELPPCEPVPCDKCGSTTWHLAGAPIEWWTRDTVVLRE